MNPGVIGLFLHADSLLIAANRLKGAGFTDITMFSPFPLGHEIEPFLGKKRDPIALFAFFGGIIGLLFGLLLIIGTSLLYVLPIDGRPIIAITPTIVISFETMILFGVFSTFLGFFLYVRLPSKKVKVFDIKGDIDRFGLLVKVSYSQARDVEEIIKESGAEEVKRFEENRYKEPGIKSLTTLCLLCSVIIPDFSWGMPWSGDMFNQPSMKAQEEISPFIPDGIVPTKGKTLPIKNRDEAIKLRNPYAPTDKSIAWGKVLYNSYCALCHGETGHGDGKVGEKYVPPTDLTDEYVQNKPDGDIFYTITYGGLVVMPLFGDAISPDDRWYIINYIKSVIGRN